jgi:ribonuclease T2
MTRRLAAFALLVLLSACGSLQLPNAQSSTNDASKKPASRRDSGAVAQARNTSGRGGRHRHNHHGGDRDQRQKAKGQPGAFDFYVMALSWSPGFCASPAGRNDTQQCGTQRNFGFVLHGLWPQYENGGWPETCTTEALDRSLVNGMLDIMPSPKLIAHEWAKHGTCSGLSEKEYFEDAADAFHAIKIPPAYQGPHQQVVVNPAKLREDFGRANPSMGADDFVVICTRNGRFLQEVRACLNKDLDGRACNREVVRSACRSDEIIMQPLR